MTMTIQEKEIQKQIEQQKLMTQNEIEQQKTSNSK